MSGAVYMVFMVCLASGWADPTHYNINDRVDNILPQINNLILGKHFDSVRVADYVGQSGPILVGVSVQNMSTLVRSGDAEMWQVDDKTLGVSVNLGLKEAIIHIDSAPFIQDSCTWQVGDASLQMGFTLHPTPTSDCVTTYQYFTLTKLDKVIMHTSNPKWDGKSPPADILSGIIPFYNKWTSTPEVLQAVADGFNLCDPIPNTNLLLITM